MSGVKDIDRGWKRIKRDLRDLDGSNTKVGIHSGQLHSSVDGVSDMVMIGAANEFGTKNIPSRSFMRDAFDKNKQVIGDLQDSLFAKVITNTISARQGLSILGEFMTNKIKLSIKNLKTPPNKPATIQRKKSSNPLIDKGQLVQSITHSEFVS